MTTNPFLVTSAFPATKTSSVEENNFPPAATAEINHLINYANHREGATPVTHHGETGLPQFHNLPYLISGGNEWPNYLLRHRGDATRPAKHKKADSMATLNQLPHVVN